MHVRPVQPERAPSQTWSVFLKNQATGIWAYDFLLVIDLFFRNLFVFFILEFSSRRVVRFGVTRHPTDGWVAQQLCEATAFREAPRFLIRDRDCKYGKAFLRVPKGIHIQILKTLYRTPKANASGRCSDRVRRKETRRWMTQFC